MIVFCCLEHNSCLGRRFRGRSRAPRRTDREQAARTVKGGQVLVESTLLHRVAPLIGQKESRPQHRGTSSDPTTRPTSCLPWLTLHSQAWLQSTPAGNVIAKPYPRAISKTVQICTDPARVPDKAPRSRRAAVKRLKTTFVLGDAQMIIADHIFLVRNEILQSSSLASSLRCSVPASLSSAS